MSNPWFRMYVDFLTDSKMIAIAFEDQRHYIGVLALKSSGILDQKASDVMMNRIVSQRLWIDHSLILDVKKRLLDAELIDAYWQPIAWDKRQKKSDYSLTGAERAKNYRDRAKNGIDKQIGEQNNSCDCCGEPFKTPYSLHVVMDHDHVTKQNRALVCQSCNKVIGQIENGGACVSPKKLLAESYIQKHSVTLRNGSVTGADKNRTEENIVNNTKISKPKVNIPEWLPEDSLKDFKEHRAKLKKPLTDKAVELFITKLSGIKEKGFDPVECINKAIENGWLTVYEPKDQMNNVAKQHEWKTY